MLLQHPYRNSLLSRSACADEIPQVVPTDAAAALEPPASADQPAFDESETAGSTQAPISDSSLIDIAGVEVVDEASAGQNPARDAPQQTQVLHVCLGPLPDTHTSCKAFYFMRNQPGKLVLEDIDTQLECGIMSEGPSLKMLQQVSA